MKLFSNEIVFRGHPDKVCDQISGAILDTCLRQDPNARVAVEVCGGKGKIFVTGEITAAAKYDVDFIVRRVIEDCGYDPIGYEIIDNIGKQSPNIAQGVDVGGAGDNGMMFGYACNATPQGLPVAMVILQDFAKAYDELRKKDARFYSDGKAQITGIYDDEFNLTGIKTFTICYQNFEQDRTTTDEIVKQLALTCVAKHKYNHVFLGDNVESTISVEQFLINPTGKFFIGGFVGDAGLTGRKIVVDAYQSFANVGGGCMNGKDPSKVDLSGAHFARMLAKDILQIEKLKWCEVQVSFAIGVAEPLAIYIDSDRGNLDPDAIGDLYEAGKPQNIIDGLKMKELCYEELAKFGHFTN